MGLYEYGCTDPGCSKCVGEGFNPGGGWGDDEDERGYVSPLPTATKKRKKKANGKKARVKGSR